MESKISLNLNAKPYVPKTYPIKTQVSSIQQHTSLNLAGSKPFIPKGRKFEIKSTTQAIPPKEPAPTPAPEPAPAPAPKVKKVDREYFVIDEDDKQQYNFDYDYMISFENWEICQETKLLSPEFLKHLEDFKIVESETIKSNNQNKQGQRKKDYYNKSNNKSNEKKNDTDLSVFGRKDITKELAQAEEFKKKIDEEAKKDPIKFQITEHLNILTVDNYRTTADNIYEIIKEDVSYQEKFLDVLFNKSVNEKAYVKLYAKLCKEFDKKLPQKTPPKEDKNNDKKEAEKKEEEKDKNNSTAANPPKEKDKDKDKDKNAPAPVKKQTSIMRTKLLDKCREIFKIENNEKFDQYIKVQDPVEREIKLKKFVLGNVNFIGELINIQILSKKIVKQCLENLFVRYNKSNTDKTLKMINLEAIVVLLDNFGTLLKLKESKMKEEDKKNFNEIVNDYLKKLAEVIEKEDLVQHVKYKIINLIERSKNNWEKSKFSQSLDAKGKKDLEDQDENEKNERGKSTLKKYTQDEITDEISKDLINFKDHIYEEDGTPKDYNWDIVESIYHEHGNSVAEMIQGFLYSCLDFVQNQKTLKLAKDYFTELIFYYKKTINFQEKKDIIKRTAHLLKVARDLSLDNLLIIDVWCIMLSNLIRAHLFSRDDLIELNDLEKEDLKTVFIIIAKIIKEDPEAKIHYDKCKFVQQNKALYDEVMNEINNKS